MSEVLTQIGSLLGSALGGGSVGAISSAITEALKLINHLTKDDPVKNARAIREYTLKMVEVVNEVRKADPGFDVSELVAQLTKLLNS